MERFTRITSRTGVRLPSPPGFVLSAAQNEACPGVASAQQDRKTGHVPAKSINEAGEKKFFACKNLLTFISSKVFVVLENITLA